MSDNTSIGSIFLDVVLNTDGIERQISQINTSKIKPSVDLESLHQLNQLLDVKKRHLAETVSYFNSNPIRPSIDTSEIKKLDALLNTLRASRIDIDVRASDSSLRQIQQQVGNLNVSLQSDREVLNRLDKIADRVGDASSKKGSGGVFKSIATGGLENLGRTTSNSFSTALTEGLGTDLANVFGSGSLVGRKIAQKISDVVSTNLQTLKREKNFTGLDVIKEKASDFLGAKDIAIEANFSREDVLQRQRSKLQRAREGALAEIRLREETYTKSAQSAAEALRRNVPRIEAANKLLIGELENQIRIDEKIAKNPSDLQTRVAMVKTIQRVDDLRSVIDTFDQENESKVSKAEIEKRRKVAAENQLRLLKEKPLPSQYAEMVRDANPNIREDQIPKLLRGGADLKRRKADAEYSPLKNSIEVNPALYDKLLGGEKLGEKDFKIVAEEINHALDFKFGDFKGFQAAQDLRLLPETKIKATDEERKKLEKELSKYKPEVREIELNAKVKALRAWEKEDSRREKNLAEKLGGIAGSSIRADFDIKSKDVLPRISRIKQVAQEKGFKELPALRAIEKETDYLQRQADYLAAQFSEASKGNLSTESLRQLSTDIVRLEMATRRLNSRVDNVRDATLKLGTKYDGRTFSTAPEKALAKKVKSGFKGFSQDVEEEIKGKAQEIRDREIDLNAVASNISKAAGKAAEFSGNAYSFAKGVESTLMPKGSIGSKAKTILQTTVLPTLAYQSLPMLGPVGQAAQGVIGAGGRQILSLAGGATGLGELATAIGGGVSSIPIIGSSLAGLGGAASTGLLELGGAVIAPIAAGVGTKTAFSVAKAVSQTKKKMNGLSALSPEQMGVLMASKALESAEAIKDKLVQTEIEQIKGNKAISGAGGLRQLAGAEIEAITKKKSKKKAASDNIEQLMELDIPIEQPKAKKKKSPRIDPNIKSAEVEIVEIEAPQRMRDVTSFTQKVPKLGKNIQGWANPVATKITELQDKLKVASAVSNQTIDASVKTEDDGLRRSFQSLEDDLDGRTRRTLGKAIDMRTGGSQKTKSPSAQLLNGVDNYTYDLINKIEGSLDNFDKSFDRIEENGPKAKNLNNLRVNRNRNKRKYNAKQESLLAGEEAINRINKSLDNVDSVEKAIVGTEQGNVFKAYGGGGGGGGGGGVVAVVEVVEVVEVEVEV
jgi:hypothetical protein